MLRPFVRVSENALTCCWLTGKLNICPKHVGYEFVWSWGKARGHTSVQGRTELMSLCCSFSGT